jgi:NhaA family Na+:H+ antiporter
MTWMQIVGVGVLAGIGFTVSLFIGGLAFGDSADLDTAKTAVLLASVVAGVAGFALLRGASARSQPKG